MRRRHVVDRSLVPGRLRRFDPEQWPSFEAWRAARLEFHEANPGAWPDVVAVLQGSRNAWLKLGGLLPMHPGVDEWEVDR